MENRMLDRVPMLVASALLSLVVVLLALPTPAGGDAPAQKKDEAAPAAAKDVGKELYTQKCAMCHGADGVAKPMGKGSANLNDPAWQKAATDEAIATVTRDGRNKMPKFDKLSPDQIQAIVAYVRRLK